MVDYHTHTTETFRPHPEWPRMRPAVWLAVVLVSVLFPMRAASRALGSTALASQSQNETVALSDYSSAYRLAQEKRVMLLVAFVNAEDEEPTKTQIQSLMQDANLQTHVVPVIVPIGATVELNGEQIVLSNHATFAGLTGQPGVAVVNLAADKSDPEYGRVIWTFSLKDRDWAAQQEVIRLSLVELAASYHGRQESAELIPSTPESNSSASQQENEVVLTTHLSPQQTSIWMTNYENAVAKAKNEKKMLLVYLRPEQPDPQIGEFERRTLLDPQVMKELLRYVCVRIPETYVIEENGTKTRLLDHPSLVEMEHQPGLFIVDYASTEAEYYSQVVSVFPFLNGRPYNVEQMSIILTLPSGTLTQRTMIYAVRVHPERPKSILGRPDSFLFKEAEKHSAYQARIRLLGHHFWETRFHRIIQTLRGESTASEVCAESWPGQGLLAAALECVRCWRLSPGHWRSVSSYQDAYGYDIKKGSDGIWYATGIFANRR